MTHLLLSELPDDFSAFAEASIGFDMWIGAEDGDPWSPMVSHPADPKYADVVPLDLLTGETIALAWLALRLDAPKEAVAEGVVFFHCGEKYGGWHLVAGAHRIRRDFSFWWEYTKGDLVSLAKGITDRPEAIRAAVLECVEVNDG